MGVASTPTSAGAQAPAVTTATRARTPPAADAVVVLVDRLDAAAARAPRQAVAPSACDGGVGEDDAAVRLEEAALAGLGPDREALLDLACVEHLERHAARGERVAVRLPSRRGRACRAGRAARRPHSASSSRQSGKRLLREPHPALLRDRTGGRSASLPWLEPRSWPSSNCSQTTTSRPAWASARAVASPITPAPTTTTSVSKAAHAGAA